MIGTKMFGKRFGVDLGTANVLVYAKGRSRSASTSSTTQERRS